MRAVVGGYDLGNLDLFKKDFVLSIRPMYAGKIVDGIKTVELRRRFPDLTVTGASMFVYATAPVQAVIGHVTIARVERRPIDVIWSMYHEVAFIDPEAFQAYFAGLSDGFVLVLEDPVRLKTPVDLDSLKSTCGFTPPQSFAYADDRLVRLLRAS